MDRALFWERVCALCLAFDGSVTSGIRSAAHNKQVGGVPLSRHLRGFAADVVLDEWSNAPDFGALCVHMGIQVIDERAKKGHLHLQARPGS